MRGGICRHFATSVRGPQTDSLAKYLQRNAPIDVHPEVREALAANKPVVALETTIVTHGMPFPTNLETARSVESKVRLTGSIPATIGMINGRVKIGLQPAELERLADTKRNPSVIKLSRRDIGPAIAMKRDGGTTCSATLLFAELAGIKVFSTGGLGGVHRNGENSMDISADLAELTRCRIALVSAGVKSILDIGRTLEYLETLGVPVLSFGKTNDFPAFFIPRSGFKTSWHTDSPKTVADILFAQWKLGMQHGVLIGAPIPAEYEAVGAEIQEYVEQAIRESEANGVSKSGKEATPWILRRVAKLTQGKSLPSNIALIENTALIGGKIAAEYAKLATGQGQDSIEANRSSVLVQIKNLKDDITSLPPAKLVVTGSAAVDITAKANPVASKELASYSTSPGTVSMTLGGVGRNIAEASYRILSSRHDDLATSILLVSPIGQDASGRLIVEETQRIGMRTDGLLVNNKRRSAVCNMVLSDAGNLIGGVADMDIAQSLNFEQVLPYLERNPSIIAIDGNLSPKTVTSMVQYCNKNNIKVFFEPTSIVKSITILPAIAATIDLSDPQRSPVTFASPNILELTRLYHGARDEPFDLISHPSWWKVLDNLALGSEFRMELEQLTKQRASSDTGSKETLSFLVEKGVAQMAINLLPFFQHLIVKCGELGVVLVMRVPGQDISTTGWAYTRSDPRNRCILARGKSSALVVLKHYPALPVKEVANVTGAGDSLVGSILASLVQNPMAFTNPTTTDETINLAQQAAMLTLSSELAVSPMLSSI